MDRYDVEVSTQAPHQIFGELGFVEIEPDPIAIDSMPIGTIGKKVVFIFNLGTQVEDDELKKLYNMRNLKPADVTTMAELNRQHPELVREHQLATHWQNDKGVWCACIVSLWEEQKEFYIDSNPRLWSRMTWFVGIRD